MCFLFVLEDALYKIACDSCVEGSASAGYDVGEVAAFGHADDRKTLPGAGM